MKILIRLAVLTVSISLFTSVCTAEESFKFKLGVLQSLSGHAEEDGNNILRAIELATEEINSRGPDSVELLVEDDRTQAGDTVSAYQRLKLSGVDAIIGATWVHTTESITPLAAKDKLVVFSASSFPETINFKLGKGFVFTNVYSLETDVKTFEHFAETRNIKSIAFIRNSSPWGIKQVEQYKKLAAEKGIRVVEEFESAQIENNDWRAVLPRIKRKKPDVVILFLGKNDIDVIMRRSQEMNLGLQFFGASHTIDGFRQSTSKGSFEGMCFTYPYEQIFRNQDFVTRFEQRFGELPRLYADSAYDAVNIITQALREAKLEEKSLRRVLEESDFDGLVGTYRYRADKSLSAGATSLVCVNQGELVAEATAKG